MRRIFISESMLCKIVSECVRYYLEESRGAIDARMGKLAELIWDTAKETIKKKENNFIIDTETINQYQDYFKATKPIEVEVLSDVNNSVKSEFKDNGDRYTISINLCYVGKTLKPIPTIIHELTHFINFQLFKPKELYSFDFGIMDKWTYLYRDIERNARISEFGYYLEGKKSNREAIDNNLYSEEYSDILKLNDMLEIINTIYYGNSINGFDPVLSLFYTNQLVPIKEKQVTDNNYYRIKNKLYQWYSTKYNDYLKKAKKLLKYYSSI